MNSPLDTQAIDLSDPRMMELMSWFSNPTQIQEPPAPEIPFMPLGEPSSGLDTLPGLEDLGDQGWDEVSTRQSTLIYSYYRLGWMYLLLKITLFELCTNMKIHFSFSALYIHIMSLRQ